MTNIEKCIREKVSISVREKAITDLSSVVEVLLLVDGYLSEMPQHTLHGFDGGVMTICEIRQHIYGAIKLTNPEYANLIQERLVIK